MRILLLSHSFNSLTQRLFVELRERGHAVTIEFDVNDKVTIEAVDSANPDLIVAPFLKRAIPAAVYENHVCLVVHPGPPGDRGPSALDWAILNGEITWGVTVLQATAEMDGGPVWASGTFPMRTATKSSLYRNEVADAAVAAVLRAVEAFPDYRPQPAPPGTWRPLCKQADRAIDWTRDDTATVLRKVRSADGTPGLLDELLGRKVYLFDAHPHFPASFPRKRESIAEPLQPNREGLSQWMPACAGMTKAGEVLGRCGQAILRATTDGAVWIGYLRWQDDEWVKLPAVMTLGELAADLPEIEGFADIRFEERNGVGYLHFPFYNGAMSTEQCLHLRDAWVAAKSSEAKVLVLMGGPDFWSNGIHLNTIESADSPADESWRNINAIDDLAEAIITTTDKWVIAAMQGNGGAGGVFLALAADVVWARDGVVLNPHYKGMGNLYGSEYWTYLLPKRCGADKALEVTRARLPIGTAEAKRLGLIDDHFGANVPAFAAEAAARAEALAADPSLPARLDEKRRRRAADEAEKPLAAYRAGELTRMKLNFYGFDPSYHVARYNFVRKVPKSRTPLYLAAHRRKAGA